MLSFPAEARAGELSCRAGQAEQRSTTSTQPEDDGMWMSHCRAALQDTNLEANVFNNMIN